MERTVRPRCLQGARQDPSSGPPSCFLPQARHLQAPKLRPLRQCAQGKVTTNVLTITHCLREAMMQRAVAIT